MYLFFTEPELYLDDIEQNGLTSFMVAYLISNLMLTAGIS